MKNETLDTELIDLYESLPNKRSMLQMLHAEKNRHLSEYLAQRFSMLLDKAYSPGMKIWWLVHGFEDFPACKECGKPNMTSRCNINGYQTEYCSAKCSHGRQAETKRKETNMSVYGCTNPSKSEGVKTKRAATNIERYGAANVWQSETIKKKIEETKEERYGDKHYVNAEKRDRTNLETYGVKNVFAADEIKDKIRHTVKERYGVDHVMENSALRDKVAAKSRYRMVHNSWVNFVCANEYSKPTFDEDFYMSHREKDFEFKFECRRCGKVFRSRVHNGGIRRCPDCFPVKSTSIKEQEMYDFLLSVYDNKIVRKNRTVLSGQELDFYMPDKNLAIEFDGLYFHSEQFGGKDRNYHLKKTDECERQGITLVHVFEDEWDNKREIVKSELKSRIGFFDQRICADSCNASKVSYDDAMDFLDANHLQGRIPSGISVGLFHKSELVAVMSFSRNRSALGHKNVNGWEMLRFCCKAGCHIPGAADKLLKFFLDEQQPESVTSYADRRWSRGELYETLGFRLDHVSRPNYWYLNNGCYIRYHRFSFRKSELPGKLAKYDPELTEVENMVANKYSRIWDCGSLVYTLEPRGK